MTPSTKRYALSPRSGDLPGLKWLDVAYIAASILNPKLDLHTIEIFSGVCPRCREARMFVGYDMGHPTAKVCFYCEVAVEHERVRDWHPDIAEAIAQAAKPAEFYTPQPVAERAESELADLQTRAEKAEAERDEARAELADLKANAKRDAVDALQQAILETLRTMSSAWPGGEVPSSRLWAELVDRDAVAVVRPGQAAEGEPHRYYKVKSALLRDGLMTESRGFVHLGPPRAKASSAAPAQPARAHELEPTFMD
jgi:hypothetical protein